MRAVQDPTSFVELSYLSSRIAKIFVVWIQIPFFPNRQRFENYFANTLNVDYCIDYFLLSQGVA